MPIELFCGHCVKSQLSVHLGLNLTTVLSIHSDFWYSAYIEFSTSVTALADVAEEDEWIHRSVGLLKLQTQDYPDLNIGRIEFYRSDIEAIWKCGLNLWDAFENHSDDLYRVVDAFVNRSGDWKRTVERKYDSICCSNLLYIDYVYVHPQFRGRNLGLAMVERCMSLSEHNCGLAVLDPLPEDHFAYSKNAKISYTQEETNKATAKLSKYWRNLGFLKVPGHRYLAFNPTLMKPTRPKHRLIRDNIERPGDATMIQSLFENPPREMRARNQQYKSKIPITIAERLVKRRESDNFERKAVFAPNKTSREVRDRSKQRCWSSICAFLNTRGGSILLGVHDSGKVIGIGEDIDRCGSLDKLMREIEDGFREKLQPHPGNHVIFIDHEIEGKTILQIKVDPDASRMYSLDNALYIRGNASNVSLTPIEAVAWWNARQTSRGSDIITRAT